MVDGGPWDNATINNNLAFTAPVSDQVLLTTGYFPAPTAAGILIVTRGIEGLKDIAALGNLSTESPTVVPFSTSGYTDCLRTDIGKPVKRNGSLLDDKTVLIYYDNTVRKWWLSRPHNVSVGDVLTVDGGQGTGTRDNRTNDFMNAGGGAVMIGKGYERFDDPPRICLTNGDTLYITAGSSQYVGADAVVANLKIKDLAASGSLNVTGAATFSNAINVTGYLNCNNLVKLKHFDSNTDASLLTYHGGGYDNAGGVAMDLYGNLMFISGSSSNSWNIYNGTANQTRYTCLSVQYGGSVTIRGNFYNNQAGRSGSEMGDLGVTEHRFSNLWCRTFHALTNGNDYDAYDDLEIVKQWGEKEPKISTNYDTSKLRPDDSDPFSMLRSAKGDAYFNVGNVISFALGCSKALAKKQDKHEATITAMYSEIEQLREKVSQLETKLSSAAA